MQKCKLNEEKGSIHHRKKADVEKFEIQELRQVDFESLRVSLEQFIYLVKPVLHKLWMRTRSNNRLLQEL
jgi:hypothetical protein